MKRTLLGFISDNKKQIVEPLIEKVLEFYGPNFQLTRTKNPSSQFFRHFNGTNNNGLPKPLAILELTENGKIEEGLIHELLHLALPLKVAFYTFEEFRNVEYYSDMANIAEHELMLPDFLKMGYSIENFLLEGFDKINYKTVKREDKRWWMYEYYRIVMTKNHVGPTKRLEAENLIKQIKQYGITQYPDLEILFKEIYSWIKAKKSSPIEEHAKQMKTLIQLYQLGNPRNYLCPDGPQNFKVITL